MNAKRIKRKDRARERQGDRWWLVRAAGAVDRHDAKSIMALEVEDFLMGVRVPRSFRPYFRGHARVPRELARNE